MDYVDVSTAPLGGISASLQQAAGNYTLKKLSVSVRVGLWPIRPIIAKLFVVITGYDLFSALLFMQLRGKVMLSASELKSL